MLPGHRPSICSSGPWGGPAISCTPSWLTSVLQDKRGEKRQLPPPWWLSFLRLQWVLGRGSGLASVDGTTAGAASIAATVASIGRTRSSPSTTARLQGALSGPLMRWLGLSQPELKAKAKTRGTAHLLKKCGWRPFSIPPSKLLLLQGRQVLQSASAASMAL